MYVVLNLINLPLIGEVNLSSGLLALILYLSAGRSRL